MSQHPAPSAAEGKGHGPASISRPLSQRERAEINGTQLVIETSETCSAASRAAVDVLLIRLNPAIWGACINLTCSPELYSAVRNVDLNLLNYKTRKLQIIERKKTPHILLCCVLKKNEIGYHAVMQIVIALHLKHTLLHHERWLMQS